MAFTVIPGLTFQGKQVGYDDEVQVVVDDPVPVTPTTTPTVPAFVAPAAVASRNQIKTSAPWQHGSGSFYSSSPLTDQNVWLIGFTAGPDKAAIATGEYGGTRAVRNWALVDNTNGQIIAENKAQMPGVQLNGTSSPLAPRVALTSGRRYTFAIWNEQPGVSSGMVGQLYL